jgi:hypothetical protein
MLTANCNNYLIAWLRFLAGLSLLVSFARGPLTEAQERHAYLGLVRAIDTTGFGVSNPVGLMFSPTAKAFLVLGAQSLNQAKSTTAHIVMFTLYEDPAGALNVTASIADPLNMTFDASANQVVVFERATTALRALPITPTGAHDPVGQAATELIAQPLGSVTPQGMTIDPQSRRLFILDAAGSRIIGISVSPQKPTVGAAAATHSQIVPTDLTSLGGVPLRGMAFNPNNGHLYLVSPTEQMLYEIAQTGQVIAIRDLAPLKLQDPQGMVFAPSGDPTDDHAQMNLYIVDSGRSAGKGPGQGRILELSLTPPVLVALPASSTQASLVRTIKTSQWSPPSPDPTGVAYLSSSGRLLVSDSEVDEMPRLFKGVNVFESTATGSLVKTYSTTSFSKEPADVTMNPSNGHRFFADDGSDKIFEVGQGRDGLYGTADDTRTSFSTRTFNSFDPEGLAFGQGSLFVSDGGGAEVYKISPGANGIFDGVAPAGDDRVTHFDTARIGQPVPEGIAFNTSTGSLYIVSNKRDSNIVETTVTGTVIRVINISFLNAVAPAGLGYAPGSRHLYIADRGIDNNANPNENDGKIYEISF